MPALLAMPGVLEESPPNILTLAGAPHTQNNYCPLTSSDQPKAGSACLQKKLAPPTSIPIAYATRPLRQTCLE